MFEVQWLQNNTGIRTPVTRLMDEQFHETDAFFAEAGNCPKAQVFSHFRWCGQRESKPRRNFSSVPNPAVCCAFTQRLKPSAMQEKAR